MNSKTTRSKFSCLAVLTVLNVTGGLAFRFFSVTPVVPSKSGSEVSPDSDATVLAGEDGVAVGEMTGVALELEAGLVFESRVHDKAATQQVSNRIVCVLFMLPFPLDLAVQAGWRISCEPFELDQFCADQFVCLNEDSDSND